jgi:hypothetical protein
MDEAKLDAKLGEGEGAKLGEVEGAKLGEGKEIS